MGALAVDADRKRRAAAQWSIRPLTRETQTRLAQLAALLMGSAGLAAVGSAVGITDQLSNPVGLFVTGTVAAVLAAGLAIVGTFFPGLFERHLVAAAYLILVGATVMVTLGLAFAGPQATVVVVVYAEAPVFAFYLLQWRAAALIVPVIGLEYAIMVSVVPGFRLPAVQWLFLMGSVVVIGGAFGWLMARADRLAASELRARDELARTNAALETRVREQVDELERMNRLRRFLSPQVAEMILSAGEEGMLSAHRQEIAVLFCDLRSFTSFTSRAEPEVVLEVLDEYYRAVGALLHACDATIGSCAGDGIMAYFNDPVPCPQPARAAIEMALRLRAPMAVLVSTWERRGFGLGYGVGIALGHATLGTIGFGERSDYAAVGSVVNLAARLSSEAASTEILIDARAHDAVGDLLDVEPRNVALKGFAELVPVFNVVDGRLASPALTHPE